MSSVGEPIDLASGDSAPALTRNRIGYPLLIGLGIGYVIAGQFATWNLGLARGGLLSLLVALTFATSMYAALMSVLAELAAMMPTAGGGYAFARRAFGPAAGFLVGAIAALEYLVATAGVAVFATAQVQELTGYGGWPVVTALFLTCVILHMRGVTKALSVTLVLTITAIVGVTVFLAISLPHVSATNIDLGSIAHPLLEGRATGLSGAWAALPFAIGFYLGIEALPLASEEVKDPTRNVPRAIRTTLRLTAVASLITTIVAVGAAGVAIVAVAPAPLIATLRSIHVPAPFVLFVNIAGLVALLSGFFSAMFACSRQIFALARAGHLPARLASTNSRGAPAAAIVWPGALGLCLALTGAVDKIVVLTTLFAALTYIVMFAVHWRLRVREPHASRPFRSRGGRMVPAMGFLLAGVSFAGSVLDNVRWALYAAALLAVLSLYFVLFGRGGPSSP